MEHHLPSHYILFKHAFPYTYTVDHHNNPREVSRASMFTSSFYQWEFELKAKIQPRSLTVSVKTKVKFQVT